MNNAEIHPCRIKTQQNEEKTFEQYRIGERGKEG
jgi:hypothetical protein